VTRTALLILAEVPSPVNQNICLKQYKGLAMNRLNTPASPSTQSLHALRVRIEHEAPWLHIVRCIEGLYPFIEVKDTSNRNIHVAFSSDVAYTTFIQVVGKGRDA
jgi:hypothetical protein